jgi:hypothetical protein
MRENAWAIVLFGGVFLGLAVSKYSEGLGVAVGAVCVFAAIMLSRAERDRHK